MVYSSSRRFQVWRWSVGHKALLLRSNPYPGHPRRIELLFKPAYAVCLPSWFDGVAVQQADEVATGAWSAQGHGLALEVDQNLWLVRAGSVQGWVVGGSASGREDDGDYDTPSSFDGLVPGPEVDLLFTTYRE